MNLCIFHWSTAQGGEEKMALFVSVSLHQVAVLCLNACLPSSTHFIESMMCISPFAETERLQYVAVASTRGAVIFFSIAVLQDYNTDA